MKFGSVSLMLALVLTAIVLIAGCVRPAEDSDELLIKEEENGSFTFPESQSPD